MNATLFRNLEVVNGGPRWLETMNKAVESGGNFLMVLPDAKPDQSKIAGLFQSGKLPERLSRFTLIHLSQYLESEDFDFLMLALDADKMVILVDQLELALTQPPRVRTFMVYSATFGILSHHGGLSEARASLARFEDSTFSCRHNSDACIYFWDENGWVLFDEL